MQKHSPAARRFVNVFVALGFIAVFATSVSAQETSVSASFASNGREAIPINVLVGQSRVINFDRSIGRFSVSNPEVAEAVLVAPDQVLVNGKSFGQVNFIAWDKTAGGFVVFDVFVRTNLSLIDAQIRALFPKDDIRLSQANGSVVLSGSVTDPKVVAQAQSVVEAAGFKTVNLLQGPVKSIAQVQLQVRVAEVSRSKMRELGSSFASVNGGTSVFTSPNGPASLGSASNGVLNMLQTGVNLFLFNNAIGTQAYIRALQTNGALRALAEPNLIAMDGQQASFLAGGEYPVPMLQNSGGDRATVTIVFKEYGVRLNFKPTIIDEDHIRLELEPEVSTIDFANGVKFDGFIIPALRTRRAKTGVELRDGQSFALAGLLDNNESRSLSKVPLLGDIPILGALFRSSQFQRQETELMFFVTAQLVKPVNRDDLPALRGVDNLRNGSPLGVEPRGEGITGASGHSTGSNGTQPATTTPAAQPALQRNAPAPSTTTVTGVASFKGLALPEPQVILPEFTPQPQPAQAPVTQARTNSVPPIPR
ncbi:MAG: type II and III secretion system protein family protein [Pyrinomonadaceae bacterium]